MFSVGWDSPKSSVSRRGCQAPSLGERCLQTSGAPQIVAKPMSWAVHYHIVSHNQILPCWAYVEEVNPGFFPTRSVSYVGFFLCRCAAQFFLTQNDHKLSAKTWGAFWDQIDDSSRPFQIKHSPQRFCRSSAGNCTSLLYIRRAAIWVKGPTGQAWSGDLFQIKHHDNARCGGSPLNFADWLGQIFFVNTSEEFMDMLGSFWWSPGHLEQSFLQTTWQKNVAQHPGVAW